MAWVTPKTDWAVPDIVQTTDMNNIGNNLQYLYDTIYNKDPLTSAANSSLQLDLNPDYNLHSISSSTFNIEFISTNGRVFGEKITLIYIGSTNIDIIEWTAGSPPAGYGFIRTYQTLTLQEYEAISLVYYSTDMWVPLFCSY